MKVINTTDKSCSTCFKSLGVDARYKIYTHLKSNGAKSVSDIVTILGLTQPTVSYHLKDMHTSGLLNSKKIGKEVLYSVSNLCVQNNCACVLKEVEFK